MKYVNQMAFLRETSQTYHSKPNCFTTTAATFDYPHIQHVVFGWIYNQTKSCLAYMYANVGDS